MATLDDVAAFVASAASMTVGTDLFKGTLPDTPDVAGSVHEYGGSAPDFVLGRSAIATEFPRFQLRFRGTMRDYQTPRAKAELAYRACAAAANTTLGTTRYQRLLPLQPPYELARDGKERIVIAFNVEAMKELTA